MGHGPPVAGPFRMFCELQQDYGIDFVSRVRDEKLDLNGHIQWQLAEPDRDWSEFEEDRQFSGRQETQKVKVTALRPITLISDETPAHRQIAVNIVVASQSHPDGSPVLDQNGKDTQRAFRIFRTDYVTSLQPGRHGVKVCGFYQGRWGIENQGFRTRSQTWDIDRPAGHSYGAVAGAVGVRVPDLQRAPFVRAGKPAAARLRRGIAADAGLRPRGSLQNRP